DHIYLPDDFVQLGFDLVLDVVPVQVIQNVRLHPHLGRAEKENANALKLGQQVGERTHGAPFIELAQERYAETVQRTHAVDSVEIEQRLSGMLSTPAIAGIDDGDLGN